MSKTTDAVKIINQMIADDPSIQELIAIESLNIEVSQLIYESRIKAGLTQQQLADLVGVKYDIIVSLEDADYEGNSLVMLQKIATALNQRIKVSFVS
ncbi:transcriptional regulator [Crocosphaera sp. XPORK-15E]|uniref:transcriptional regulator n=1 Tax=Crocosphaera sp. XPORK-15E TaxID=3110247 RepID=UPI002B2217BC|nr:transcriptional regulator [Crocosphaera sp. XPORK-15E]MEA5534327.1 transcriptional regulator [Crocosphaera sp. XPORK-15E]